MPNRANFENMDAMAATLRRGARGGKVLGLVNTWWAPWRGLRDAYLPAAAYTAAMVRQAGPVRRGLHSWPACAGNSSASVAPPAG